MHRPGGRILEAFAGAAAEGRAALVAYTTAGHPNPDQGLEALLAIADAGADVLELGIPFSDPLADGPTIQRSSFEVIELGVDLAWSLELLGRFRAERDTPVVLFSYLNPIMNFGIEPFITAAVRAGADGVLLTDLPMGADVGLEERFEASPLDLVRLIAPTTTPERAKLIAGRSQGFVYYISRTGVTGARVDLPPDLAQHVTTLRAASELPVAVGFGISTAAQAAAVGMVADGIVVGSALVDALRSGGIDAGRRLVAELRQSLGAEERATEPSTGRAASV